MTPKLTDEQIIKAYEICNVEGSCNDCPAKDTKYCDTLPKDIFDLINRLKADVERLETGQLKEAMTFNSNTIDDTVNEALEEFVNKIHSIITEIYDKYVFNGFNDLNSEEIDAVINYSDDVTQEIDNFLKEKVGD